MVRAVRRGRSMRQVARDFGVSLATVQRWVQRARDRRLDRVDWSDRPEGCSRSPRRTPAEMEDLNIGQEQVLELISYIVVNLVEHPDDVTVDIAQRQGRDIYQVRVHQEDLGKVIGKGGQTARALRVLLMAVSASTYQLICLEIVE